MTRLMATMKRDVTVQLRSNLYTIGVIAGLMMAAVLVWLVGPEQLLSFVPALMLFVVGGSTLLYVAAMIILEKDQGTMDAMMVSPLRPSEYLWSKIITLSSLALLESIIMVGGATLALRLTNELSLPNVPLLLLGVACIGVMYTLVGIILVVRFDKITDFLIPVSGIAMMLQLPFLYFLGWVTSPLLLLIPTSAPTMLVQGAYRPLTGGEWLYGIGYTIVLLVGLTIWAYRAFEKHIIHQVG